MRKSGNVSQSAPSIQIRHIVALLLMSILLNACLGCKEVLDLNVQNNSASTITIIKISKVFKEDGVHVYRWKLGTVSPGSTQKFGGVLTPEEKQYFLEVQNSSNTAIGEVSQAGDIVRAKMNGSTWIVKIPEDMTPLLAGKTTVDAPD